jgi:hypothetical protein
MKYVLGCQWNIDHKIWGIRDHYQKKCGMFFETSYVWLSGRTKRKIKLPIFQDRQLAEL